MGLWGVAFPYIDQSPAGKTPAEAVGISVVIDEKDLRLVRPRVLKVVWWLLVGATWLSA